MQFKQIGSTNVKAAQLAAEGAPEWTVVAAAVQTQGRGRGGKAWDSPEGGLWFSVVLRPQLSASKAGLLQLMAGAGTRSAVEDATRVRVLVKWPNDLILDGQKLGGILVETKLVADMVRFAVLGIGINVNQPRDLLVPGAISLFTATRREQSFERLLKSIVESLQSKYSELDKPHQIALEWWEHCVHRDKHVMVEDEQQRVEGRCVGVNEQGHLQLETEPGKLVDVSEGTLRILE